MQIMLMCTFDTETQQGNLIANCPVETVPQVISKIIIDTKVTTALKQAKDSAKPKQEKLPFD